MMKKHNNGFITKCKAAVLATGLLFAVLAGQAEANGGPLQEAPGGGGPLLFDEATAVVLAEERVMYDFAAAAVQGGLKQPKVSVRYKLRNDGPQEARFEMMFLTPDWIQETVDVRLNGREAAAERVDRPELGNWSPAAEADDGAGEGRGGGFAFTDPLDGRRWPYRPMDHSVRGLRIPVAIAAGATAELTVEYRELGGLNERRVVEPVYGFLYYMTPASYWADAAKVELQVRLPADGRYALHSNIPLAQAEEGGRLYETRLDGVPAEEWMLSLVDTSALPFGTNRPLRHNSWLLLVWLAVGAAGTALSVWLRSRIVYAAGWLAATVVWCWGLRVFLGYPFDPLAIYVADAALIAVPLVLYVKWRRRLRRSA